MEYNLHICFCISAGKSFHRTDYQHQDCRFKENAGTLKKVCNRICPASFGKSDATNTSRAETVFSALSSIHRVTFLLCCVVVMYGCEGWATKEAEG